MSYCRWTRDSDVYVFSYNCQDPMYCDPIGKGFVCCSCNFNKDRNFLCKTRQGMIKHLIKHRNNGEDVPDYAFERLRRGE